MDKQFQFLKQFLLKIHPNLKDETIEAFYSKLVPLAFKKGKSISSEGKVNNAVYFITQGATMVFNHVGSKKVVYNFFFEGEYTGDYESFLTQKPAVYGIETLENTQIMKLSYANLQFLYENYPELERIGRLVAEAQFLRLVQRNSDLHSKKPEERYLDLFQEKPQVIQRIPQYYIASYLGITPEALSRIRKRLLSA